MCRFVCPQNCSCVGTAVDCRNTGFGLANIQTLSTYTRKLDLSLNDGLSQGTLMIEVALPFLFSLNVSSCGIKELTAQTFFGTENLVILDLSYNKFKILPEGLFNPVGKLKQLILNGNRELETIEPFAFVGVTLHHLRISGTKITKLKKNTFAQLTVERLELSNNAIRSVDDLAFNSLESKEIVLLENDLTYFNSNIFGGIKNLQVLRTPAYKFCCVRPTDLKESDCYPYKDEFSSCEDLMRNTVLQIFLWVIGVMAVIGNSIALLYRVTFDRPRLAIGFGMFVTNLAISDLLMGVYLIIIAIADVVYRDR